MPAGENGGMRTRSWLRERRITTSPVPIAEKSSQLTATAKENTAATNVISPTDLAKADINPNIEKKSTPPEKAECAVSLHPDFSSILEGKSDVFLVIDCNVVNHAVPKFFVEFGDGILFG